MMARIMRASDAGFADAYRALLSERGARVDAAETAAAKMIEAVRKNGVDAVLQLTEQFDGLKLRREDLVVGEAQRKRARAACPPDLVKALEAAAERILAFHERERPKQETWEDAQGLKLGFRWTPVERAGLYAPGGLAAYPSSVLMNALPAKAAGVGAVAMATPPGRLNENPAILAAADIAGVEEIWAIGGAQAIAALAYGAGDLKACDVVVGPGNAYVAAAKKLVFGDVGIDGVAGPSEVFILADGSAPASWIAADLMAQAEHDADAQSVLFTTDEAYAHEVASEVERMIAAGEAGVSARESWDRHGAIVLVKSLDEAAPLSDSAAPEHVQIAAEDAERLSALVRHAGAIFLGAHAPEALGDYVAGPSHVLPTGRRARFSSGVSTQTFMKRTTLIGAGAEALREIGPGAARIADAEGLPAHARSIRVRLNS